MSDLYLKEQIKKDKQERQKQRLKYFSRFLFFSGGLALILLSVLRCTTFATTQTFHELLLSVLFLVFGLQICTSQFGIQSVVDNFRFLNYYWGKSAFSLFLASISFTSKQQAFQQWVLMIYFTGLFICFALLTFIDSAKDQEEDMITMKRMETSDIDETDCERCPLLIEQIQTGIKEEVQRFDTMLNDKDVCGAFPVIESKQQRIEQLQLKKQRSHEQQLKEAMNNSF